MSASPFASANLETLPFVFTTGGEVPPATLREAGTLALCHSSAWDKQIVISAWWVPITQVSRGASLLDHLARASRIH